MLILIRPLLQIDKEPERNRKEGVIPFEDGPAEGFQKGKGRPGKKAVFGDGPVISGPDGEGRQAKKGRREK